MGKPHGAAGSPDSTANALAVPSYPHLILLVDVYVMKGLMVQFLGVHKQLCLRPGVGAARRAPAGRASPRLPGYDFQQGPLGGILFLFTVSSERSLFAQQRSAHHLLGAREHPNKPLPVLMLTEAPGES